MRRYALMVVAVTLVGCGGTSLRRPLVTDETPLGTSRAEVARWHLANGWCEVATRWPSIDIYQPCTAPDRSRILVMLHFKPEIPQLGLTGAVVVARVPPDQSGPSQPSSFVFRESRPTWYEPDVPNGETRPLRRPRPDVKYRVDDHPRARTPTDVASALLDALAVELEARHGKPIQSTDTVRIWRTTDEEIALSVDSEGAYVMERHTRRSPDPATPPTP